LLAHQRPSGSCSAATAPVELKVCAIDDEVRDAIRERIGLARTCASNHKEWRNGPHAFS
jgi:hypothetical protein